MFILHSAANSEDLFGNLVFTIKNQPLKSTFAKELFLIPNQGSERWLSQQLASEFKLWANYQFLQPPQFFKQLSRQIDSRLNNAAFNHDLMLWQIEALLRNLNDDIYAPLIQYLQDNNVAVKRYQLAVQITRLFENYQLLRPDLFDAWEQGYYLSENNAEHWQRALWLRLAHNTEPPYQADLWQAVINKLNTMTVGELKYRLPERIFIFGINTLPPIQLDYLQALSKHCDIYFYLQNPLPTITSLQQPVLHPLIATLGQQGREFQQLLLDRTRFQLYEIQPTITITNNLQQLQYDIRFGSQPQRLNNDSSINIHACHSRVREVEVLKDRLLETLEQNPDIELRDIVVTAPDIQLYAPFIKSVFESVPHSISGQNLRLSNSTLDAFIRFLQLIDSRFEWQAVVDLLELPVVFSAFDLTEDDLDLIRHWLEETRVRWGKSAQHKKGLGLPELKANTWQAGLERLLMGYAVATEDEFVDDVLPYHQLEGSSAQALGGLNDFVELLFKASAELKQAQTFQDWQNLLHQYAGALFVNNYETQALYHLLADFNEHLSLMNQQTIELAVIIRYLENAVTEQKSVSGLLRGKLTFTSINTIRGIPFKVIAVLGMNDGDFPGLEQTPTFDLLASNPKLGDPSRRADDRQQFLELIFAAKQQLILSYIGQSQTQNAKIPPSVIMSELLEVLQQDYQLDKLVVHHPLQPFSHRYFDSSNPQLFSYSQTHAETALALSQDKTEPQNWWQGAITANSGEIIELEEMRKFFRHPQRYFMKRQLDVGLQGLENTPEAREPFSINGLDAYNINQSWIETLLQQQDFSLAKLQAQGRWLAGVLGELEFLKQQQAIAHFVLQIQALELGEPLENLAIDINIGEFRLIGKLYNGYEKGSLFYRYAKLKGRDFILALLHHCLVNQHQKQSTYLVAEDELIEFTAELQSPEILETLLNIYLKGLEQPNVLFSDIALDYVKQMDTLQKSTRASKPAKDVAIDKLKLALEQSHQMELQKLYLHSEDLTTLLSEEFITFCEQFLYPIWQIVHKEAS